MSWMEKLYQTYQAGILLELPLEKRLIPTSHTPQNAHINIVIDGAGNFKRASVLEKTQIVLPATEDSASRGSGEAPHPLADKLQYVAQDYASFGGKKKAYFESYEKQLRAWCESKYSHKKVTAIYNYIKKGRVIQDLIDQRIVFVDSENVLMTQWDADIGEMPKLFKALPKEKGLLDQGAALVCWTVEMDSDPNVDTWKDASIQESWIAYSALNGGHSGLCFVTGSAQTLSTKHPAKIRHSGDKAKLISSNDNSGYTYRGRFIEDSEACGISFDVTQKAHNALSWLISRQGFRNGDQAYVSWAVSGKSIPKPLPDRYQFLQNDEFDLEETEDSMALIPETEKDFSADIGQSYALKVRNYMAGYAAKLDQNEQIIIMGIDSATPGRMGVIYYRELFRDDFFDRLKAWHIEFAWRQRHTQKITNDTDKKTKVKVIWPICSPIPRDIITAAYGENVSEKLKKKVIERLIPCIIDAQPFPLDMVNSCIHQVTNRAAYASDEQWLWEKNLGIACALYRGFYHRNPDSTKRREYAMALDKNYHSRDYLFGRLLAIAEHIEEIALRMSDEKRPTNAARLMQRFANRPAETWLVIYKALDPYMQRLRVSRAGFLTNQLKELGDVNDAFMIEDYNNNEPLSGEFLLGYYCQRQETNKEEALNKERFKIESSNADTTEKGE